MDGCIILMKKFFTKILKLFYKYDSRYTIVKDNKFKYDKTIVWSVDHSWNSVEWCLPGVYYLKKHYNFNLVFFAADPEIWQRAHEENTIYAILKETCDVIIINTVDTFKCSWLQKKAYRLRKSLLEEESLKYFFGNIKVDILLELMNPRAVDKYFQQYHPNTIRVGYEHAPCDKLTAAMSKIVLPNVDFYFCADSEIYDLSDEKDKNRVIVSGAPQLDIWWRDLISNKSILDLQQRLDSKKKTILVLLPAILNNARWYDDDKEALIRVLEFFYGKENILLKFHPREKKETVDRFEKNICGGDKIYTTTLTTECVAKIADCVVVAGVTTAAGPAIINDVPVIEFHSNREMESLYCDKGQYGTLLKIKNVVISAENYKMLKDAISRVLYGNIWEEYRNKYKKYIYTDNQASKRFAEAMATFGGENE